MIPGEKIKDMLDQWNSEEIMTHDDITKFAVRFYYRHLLN